MVDILVTFLLLFIYLFIYFFAISWATLAVYGGSQARSQIRATAASHSHSHAGSEQSLDVTYTTAHGKRWILNRLSRGQGSNPKPHDS